MSFATMDLDKVRARVAELEEQHHLAYANHSPQFPTELLNVVEQLIDHCGELTKEVDRLDALAERTANAKLSGDVLLQQAEVEVEQLTARLSHFSAVVIEYLAGRCGEIEVRNAMQEIK